MIKQLSIFLENRAGQLADITGVLYEKNINMMALNIAETASYGVLRIIVRETDEAMAALKDAGYIVSVSDVVGVHVPDEPGGLHKVLRILADNDIDVEYMYSVFSLREGQAYMIFKVEDPEKAELLIGDKK